MPNKAPYNRARWARIRAAQLQRAPLCAMCAEEGRVTAATVVDHVEPHRGNLMAFWRGELQSLCKSHHDAGKQKEERRGYSTQIGEDGFPVDPRHPVYRGSVHST
jgi:5-methylcytosine-specific restriction enzyme A